MIQIKSLENTPLFQIVNCFNTAFSDYFILFYVTADYMRERWRGSRVDYNLSYGAFDGTKLVGFIITGVDEWNGEKTAYNAGTGVIPAHRGNRIVEQLYEQLIPALKNKNIRHGVLEVICENDKAIRAYEKVGFTKGRRLHCVEGSISSTLELAPGMELKQEESPLWSDYHHFSIYPPTWDNHKNAIDIQPDAFEFLHLFKDDELVAYAIWKPEQNYIAQFSQKEIPYGLMLFHQISKKTDKVKINNIDYNDQMNLELVRTIGLQKNIDQWEMNANWC